MTIQSKAVFVFFLILSVLMAKADQLSDTTHYGNNPKAGHYLNTRGIKLYYETYGTGKPLLMIHGNGGNGAAFTPQIPYFSKQYKVILPDSRAQGKSTDNSDTLTYEMMADDMNALLDSLHLDSCYVMGWSDGGINGLLLAIRHPDKVKKLAVTGANLFPDSSALGNFYKEGLAYEDTLRAKPQTAATKHEYKLVHLMNIEPHISREQLATIHCPTLVIGGDHDIIQTAHTLLISQSIPRAYLWIVPHSGHATLQEHKEEFNNTVNEFFKKDWK